MQDIINQVKHLRDNFFSPYALKENAYQQACDDIIDLMQNSQQANKRFFYFTYSFYSPNNSGEGSLSLISNGFPSLKNVKQAAVERLKDKYYEPEFNFSVVILSWTELKEDDYHKWVS